MSTEFSPVALYVPISPASAVYLAHHRWQDAEDEFANAQAEGEKLAILFGSTDEDPPCVAAWAAVTQVTRADGKTRITFGEVHPVLARPIWPSLYGEEGEVEGVAYEQPRVVVTPAFVLHPPKTFLLTWNPDKEVPIDHFIEMHQRLAEGQPCVWDWTCRAKNKVRAGDRFLMLRQGTAPRGIIGSGWIRTDSWSYDATTPYVDILWESLVHPSQPLDPTGISGSDPVHWTPQGSGVELPEEACPAVWSAWQAHLSENESPSAPAQAAPEEALIEDPAASVEGRLIESWSTRRERDPALRAACLSQHDCRCAVCDMSFHEEYGDIGLGFIHVHHEHPLAAADAEKGAAQDAAQSLKPVCPNCHAMLHRGLNAALGEVRTLDELKALRAAMRPR